MQSCPPVFLFCNDLSLKALVLHIYVYSCDEFLLVLLLVVFLTVGKNLQKRSSLLSVICSCSFFVVVVDIFQKFFFCFITVVLDIVWMISITIWGIFFFKAVSVHMIQSGIGFPGIL